MRQYLGVELAIRQTGPPSAAPPPFVAGDLFRRRGDEKSQLGQEEGDAGERERERERGMDLAIAVSDLARSPPMQKAQMTPGMRAREGH